MPYSPSKSALFLILTLLILTAGAFFLIKKENQPVKEITSFTQCAEAGHPVMESYPRRCNANGRSFTEDIGNELSKTDLIRMDFPRPNQTVSSPLIIKGEARGYWFFEASFPIELKDGEGQVIAQTIATAKGDWMTEDFVAFEALMEFDKPLSKEGLLVLKKDNPSGLPEHEDSLEVPVWFEWLD